jgi:hypothetical protein
MAEKDNPIVPPDDDLVEVPEAKHLVVEKYEDDERDEPPEWAK